MVDGSRFDDLTRVLGMRSTRRRALAGIAGVVTGGLFARKASARTLTICHATGNAETPYESLEVSQAEFNLHARHGDFLRVDCCENRDCTNQSGACGMGVCENGYCTQSPQPAGTACDSGELCIAGVCDGASNCVSGDPIVCPPASDDCHDSVCDSELGCVQQAKEPGSPCTPDETHDGRCDSEGVCQPILMCTNDPICSADSDCRDGAVCLNGGCFLPCYRFEAACGNGTGCPTCQCTFLSTLDRYHFYCLDADTPIGGCNVDADCPSGTVCSGYASGSHPMQFLCTQPCQHLG